MDEKVCGDVVSDEGGGGEGEGGGGEGEGGEGEGGSEGNPQIRR